MKIRKIEKHPKKKRIILPPLGEEKNYSQSTERTSRERADEKKRGRELGEQGRWMQVVCVCACGRENKTLGACVCGMWIYRYIQSPCMYWGNFIGIFLRSSREKLRKRFSAYFLMGNFTK